MLDDDAPVTIVLGSAWGMGGTIRTVLNLAAHLAERRDVEILSVIRFRDAAFFDLPPGVKVTALDDQRPGATPRRMRALLRVHPSVLMPPAFRPFAGCSLWTDVQLVRRLRRRSGILITTHPSLNLLAADLALPGMISVGQEHMHLQAHHRSVRLELARRYPRLDALVVLTEQDGKAFAESVPDLKRLVVIPNIVRKLDTGPAAPDRKLILAAGRLTPQKGFDLLILAFAQVVAAHPDWQLRICGGGKQRKVLQRLVDGLGLEDVVSLPGPIRNLGKELERASVFALSSRFEGLPLTLLEAMSKRLAVVSTDCPTGPREVIDDHRDGILVAAGDVGALARGLLEVIADEGLRRRLGDEAAITASRYGAEAIGPRWEELFDELRRARGG